LFVRFKSIAVLLVNISDCAVITVPSAVFEFTVVNRLKEPEVFAGIHTSLAGFPSITW